MRRVLLQRDTSSAILEQLLFLGIKKLFLFASVYTEVPTSDLDIEELLRLANEEDLGSCSNAHSPFEEFYLERIRCSRIIVFSSINFWDISSAHREIESQAQEVWRKAKQRHDYGNVYLHIVMPYTEYSEQPEEEEVFYYNYSLGNLTERIRKSEEDTV